MSFWSRSMLFAHPVIQRPHRLAFAHDLRGDALADLALRAAIRDKRIRRPRKHVDKPGATASPRGIDHDLGPRVLEIADSRDAIPPQRHVGRRPSPPLPS